MASCPPHGFKTTSRPLTRLQQLARLRDKVRTGEMTPPQAFDIILTRLNPTRFSADGRLIGMHTQLTRTKFADGHARIPDGAGTPPQRHARALADRNRELVWRGTLERQGTHMTRRGRTDDNANNGGDEVAGGGGLVAGAEPRRPKTSWGMSDRGRDARQRRAACTRCASRRPSRLRLSCLAADEDGDPAALLTLGEGEAETEAKLEALARQACRYMNVSMNR